MKGLAETIVEVAVIVCVVLGLISVAGAQGLGELEYDGKTYYVVGQIVGIEGGNRSP